MAPGQLGISLGFSLNHRQVVLSFLLSTFLFLSRFDISFSCLAGVGDAGLQELSGLTSLTALNLDSRLFTDLGMRHLKPLTNLVLLDLFAAKVSDIGCGYIRYMLKGLNLTYLLFAYKGL